MIVVVCDSCGQCQSWTKGDENNCLQAEQAEAVHTVVLRVSSRLMINSKESANACLTEDRGESPRLYSWEKSLPLSN